MLVVVIGSKKCGDIQDHFWSWEENGDAPIDMAGSVQLFVPDDLADGGCLIKLYEMPNVVTELYKAEILCGTPSINGWNPSIDGTTGS